MPIFEYRCKRCGDKFEKLVRSSGTTVTCPACGGRRVEKCFSVFGSRSGGRFTPSSGGGGCGSCSKTSCSSCN